MTGSLKDLPQHPGLQWARLLVSVIIVPLLFLGYSDIRGDIATNSKVATSNASEIAGMKSDRLTSADALVIWQEIWKLQGQVQELQGRSPEVATQVRELTKEVSEMKQQLARIDEWMRSNGR